MNDNTIKNLDFHQTFRPDRNLLSNLLMNLPDCSGKTIKEISDLTGIPTGESSGKVVPTICYLKYMGLITYELDKKKYQLDYTSLGLRIVEEDPGLSEELTLLLLHCMLTRCVNGAALWSYIFLDVLPKYHGSISKQVLNDELQNHFGKEVNTSPFNGTYTAIFEQIDILRIENEKYELQKHLYNPEMIYLYGLVLYDYWQDWVTQCFKDQKEELEISDVEITAKQLADVGFRHPFGWSEADEYKVLEYLHEKNIIALNRQMVPFSIRKTSSKEELIHNLYSELC